MNRSGRSSRIGAALAGCVALASVAFACVDLFHDTGFETLCPRNPEAPECSPPPDFCSFTPDEALAKAKRACAWLSTCAGRVAQPRLGDCIVNARNAYDCDANPTLRPGGAALALWQCLARKPVSCGDIDRCLYGKGPVQQCPALDGSFLTCVEGDVNIVAQCSTSPDGGRAAGVRPCALEGRTCIDQNDSFAVCGGSGSRSCPGPTRCAGTSIIACDKGSDVPTDRGIDCASVGDGTCVDAPDGGPSCLPSPVARTCDDGVAVRCVDEGIASSCVGGREARVDCRKLGLHCDVGDAGAVPAWSPLAACQDDGGACALTDECKDGGVLTTCARGAPLDVDCEGMGLGPCVPDGSKVARCGPLSPLSPLSPP